VREAAEASPQPLSKGEGLLDIREIREIRGVVAGARWLRIPHSTTLRSE